MVGAVAVLSDVHGVLPVLEAVLAEPDVRAADLVVVTGDHAAGPDARGDPRRPGRRWGSGACWSAATPTGSSPRSPPAPRSPHPESVWAAGALRPDQLDRLAGLPHPVTLDLAGFGRTVFCHGTPRDDDEVVLVDSPPERWAEVLGGLDESVRTVVCGHTHMPFVRLVDRRLVVNPGSVGMPYGRVGGAWALLRDGQVSLRHTEIDADAVCARIVAESGYPDRAAWAEEYVRSRNSDLDALRAFTPRTRG